MVWHSPVPPTISTPLRSQGPAVGSAIGSAPNDLLMSVVPAIGGSSLLDFVPVVSGGFSSEHALSDVGTRRREIHLGKWPVVDVPDDVGAVLLFCMPSSYSHCYFRAFNSVLYLTCCFSGYAASVRPSSVDGISTGLSSV